MTENLKQTEIVVVLDRSGSMESTLDSTVEGFNSFLNEQQNAEGEAFMTLVQFDDRYEINYLKVPIAEVKPLIAKETFIPRGSTALLDAIGKTIEDLNTDRDVVFVIITDGFENASRTYTREAIAKMINTKTDDGYKFIFLAANQDAIKTGSSLGVSGDLSMSYSASTQGVGSTYAHLSKNITKYRSSKISAGIDIAAADLSFTFDQRKDSLDNE